MLKKLIHYDLRFLLSKSLIVYYIITLGLALLTRIFGCFNDIFILNIIAKICSGATISALFSTLINNVIHCWIRFRHNLFGDESYLTHTLPVKRHSHYVSKLVAGMLSLITSFVVVCLAIAIAFYSKENFALLKNMLIPVSRAMNVSIPVMVFLLIFLVFVELMSMVQCGYIGTIIGHRFNRGKVGLSFLFGILVYFVSQGIAFVLTIAVALPFSREVLELFGQNAPQNFDVFPALMIGGNVAYSALLIIGLIVGGVLLKKGVNVD